ncbi:hypothetical protein [Hymenobacter properus]|uniref:Uncharacterized protein n=1 Tax=Hymenobacter properus TaxID=2791026 RepID=A0A931BFH1_9BACT|nr:hypothetical protein [Hymenobacter properus]MBF9142929.1 hypothetical protein [Hymenobacter properus]MBR7721736.1 hypothetical protein [Microvirga sp. SRT04]
MSTLTQIPASRKSAYKRPYKTRSQRRERDRRKYDENNDYKFLLRVGIAIGALIVVAVICAVRGMSETAI